MGEVVQLDAYRDSPKKIRPFHKRYPMPFFKGQSRKLKTRPSYWRIEPTGNYGKDCKRGAALAVRFLKSCDGTYGWIYLLPAIVADMVRAGPTGCNPNGEPAVNGLIIGFMEVISKAAAVSTRHIDPARLLENQ
jgi:hypothetical protein